jgi:putative spermidine/putrescine transport system permease protein
MEYAAPEVLPLSVQLRDLRKSLQVKPLLLVLPLLIFLLLTFVGPIAYVLYNGVRDGVMAEIMPNSAIGLRSWNPHESPLPPEHVMDTFAGEMVLATRSKELSRLASRANFERHGMRGLLMSSSRALAQQTDAIPTHQQLKLIDERWSQTDAWASLKNISQEFTLNYYLNALDLRQANDGSIEQQPADLRLYKDVAVRTITISFSVAALTLILGFPVAYLLANLPTRTSNILMVFVLLPFWTSLLVRTMAWVVLLQPEGLINNVLVGLHLVSEPLPLVFNRFGVLVAMVHILMPYMVLTLYSVMKGIPPGYVRAARSLGAGPISAFFDIYLPQTYPGVFAGSLLVFILALGFYITPAILGGSQDQMLSYFIADNMNNTLNWGLATALGGLLLFGVLILFAVYAYMTMRKGETK